MHSLEVVHERRSKLVERDLDGLSSPLELSGSVVSIKLVEQQVVVEFYPGLQSRAVLHEECLSGPSSLLQGRLRDRVDELLGGVFLLSQGGGSRGRKVEVTRSHNQEGLVVHGATHHVCLFLCVESQPCRVIPCEEVVDSAAVCDGALDESGESRGSWRRGRRDR